MSIYDEIAHPQVANVSPMAGLDTAGRMLQFQNASLQNQMLAREVARQKAIADAFKQAYAPSPDTPESTASTTDYSTSLSDLGNTSPSSSLSVDQVEGREPAPAASATASSTPTPAAASDTSQTPGFDITRVMRSLTKAGFGDSAQGLMKGWTELQKLSAETDKAKGDVALQQTEAVATAAHAAKQADGHYDPDMITGILAHGAFSSIGSAAARAKLTALHTAADPGARQALADGVGQSLENLSVKQQTANASALGAAGRAQSGAAAASRESREAFQQALTNGASQLATSLARPGMYARVYAGLSPDVKAKFPAPDALAGVTADSLRQIAMTPEQQTTTAEAARYHTVEATQRGQQIGVENARLGLEAAKNKREQDTFALTYGSGLGADGKPISDEQFKAIAQNNPTAQMIAQYDLAPPSTRSITDPKGQFLMRQVHALNPSYDAKEFPTRSKMRVGYTSGSQAQQLTSLNTAIEHLGVLNDFAEALHNGSFTPGNALANKVETLFGKDAPTNFGFARDVMSGELATAMKKSGATDQEIEKVTGAISTASSPDQLSGAIKKVAVPMIGGKARVLDEQYHKTMGEKDPFSVYTPGAKAVLDKLGTGSTATPPPAGPRAPAAPKDQEVRPIPGHPGAFAKYDAKQQKWIAQ